MANKRIRKKRRTRENEELRKFCTTLKNICEKQTFDFSTAPNSSYPDKFCLDKKAIDLNKRICEENFYDVAGSSIIEKEVPQSITVTLPESGLKVEILKDRHSPFVSWKGIPPHLRLAALYNAAYPTKMQMTDDEAAMYLHNCMGEVRRINGKNLYIDNIFADVIDSTQYNIHHGHQMMQQVLYNLRKRLYENWEKGVPPYDLSDVNASIPEDIMEELKKEAKTAIDNILGLSKEEEK